MVKRQINTKVSGKIFNLPLFLSPISDFCKKKKFQHFQLEMLKLLLF